MATTFLTRRPSASILRHKSIISTTSDRSMYTAHMEIHSATSDNNMATSRDLIGVNIMYFVIVEYRLMIRSLAFRHCMFEVD